MARAPCRVPCVYLSSDEEAPSSTFLRTGRRLPPRPRAGGTFSFLVCVRAWCVSARRPACEVRVVHEVVHRELHFLLKPIYTSSAARAYTPPPPLHPRAA